MISFDVKRLDWNNALSDDKYPFMVDVNPVKDRELLKPFLRAILTTENSELEELLVKILTPDTQLTDIEKIRQVNSKARKLFDFLEAIETADILGVVDPDTDLNGIVEEDDQYYNQYNPTYKDFMFRKKWKLIKRRLNDQVFLADVPNGYFERNKEEADSRFHEMDYSCDIGTHKDFVDFWRSKVAEESKEDFENFISGSPIKSKIKVNVDSKKEMILLCVIADKLGVIRRKGGVDKFFANLFELTRDRKPSINATEFRGGKNKAQSKEYWKKIPEYKKYYDRDSGIGG